jgi:hypothetical protein
MKIGYWPISGALCLAISLMAGETFAHGCSSLPGHESLKSALASAVAQNNRGLGFNMWATLVANDGTVCVVAFSGAKFTDQ